MDVSFNDLEKRLLRFLKVEFLEKGTRPMHLSAPATMHRDVMQEFGLELREYREVMARFEHHGIVKVIAIDANNGLLHIYPVIVDIVRQLDEQTKEIKEPPNRMEETKRYFFSKWWFVCLVIAAIILTAIATIIANLKGILEWFGVER